MRISKKGDVVVERGEVRVGNFFVKVEGNGMVKISDLSGLITHRVSSDLPVGVLLVDAVKGVKDGEQNASDFLHLYASVVYLFSTVVPMVDKGDGGFNFWTEAHAFLQRAADASKSLYGMKDEPNADDEERAMDGVKNAVALEEEIKAMEEAE